MTYAIKFVNFTLAAPFQKKIYAADGGCARSTRSMVATPMRWCTVTKRLDGSRRNLLRR